MYRGRTASEGSCKNISDHAVGNWISDKLRYTWEARKIWGRNSEGIFTWSRSVKSWSSSLLHLTSQLSSPHRFYFSLTLYNQWPSRRSSTNFWVSHQMPAQAGHFELVFPSVTSNTVNRWYQESIQEKGSYHAPFSTYSLGLTSVRPRNTILSVLFAQPSSATLDLTPVAAEQDKNINDPDAAEKFQDMAAAYVSLPLFGL